MDRLKTEKYTLPRDAREKCPGESWWARSERRKEKYGALNRLEGGTMKNSQKGFLSQSLLFHSIAAKLNREIPVLKHYQKTPCAELEMSLA